jgi:hypothetical protein
VNLARNDRIPVNGLTPTWQASLREPHLGPFTRADSPTGQNLPAWAIATDR